MRVLNDRDEKSEPTELGFFPILAHSMLAALGIYSFVLAPLPLISSHLRLAEPWPKVTALAGAVIALTFLETPLDRVIIAFIFGLFVADSVWRNTSFWTLLRNTMLVALLVAAGSLILSSQLARVDVFTYWKGIVDGLFAELNQAFKVESSVRWEMMKAVFLFEGPFLYLSGIIFSMWICVGFAAHLNWFLPEHHLSSRSLRNLRLPRWLSIGFVALFVTVILGRTSLVNHMLAGIFRVVGSLMFIQGCISLSEILSRRMLKQRSRTVIYSLAVIPGFYVLVGMGVLTPWFLRKQKNLAPSPDEAPGGAWLDKGLRRPD